MGDYCSITVNKNSVHGDKSAVTPGGVRLGTSALTSRGFVEADFEKVAELMHKGIQIALQIQAKSGNMLKDFIIGLESDPRVKELKDKVETFATAHPMCGFDGAAAVAAVNM